MLREKIQNDLKKSFKEGDKETTSVLRMLFSEMKNTEIQKKKQKEGLSDNEIIEVISREVKKRKDSIEQYKRGNREDLAEKEKRELEVLMGYMPEQLNENEIKKLAQETIKRIGIVGPSDFGKVMGVLMNEVKGKAEGKVVSKVVKELLMNLNDK